MADQMPPDGGDSEQDPILRLAYTSEGGHIYESDDEFVNDDWSGEPTKRTWLIRDLIPDNRLTMLVGEGGLGKSLMATQIALAVASGDEDVLPGSELVYEHEPRTVVHVSYEEEKQEFIRRIHHLGGSDIVGRIGKRFVVFDGAAAGELWRPDPDGSGHTSTAGKGTETLAAVKRLCEQRNASMLIIDTTGHAFMSNENDRGIVNEFLRDLDHWARKHITAVVLVSHPPKSEHRYSGSSTWRGTVRAMLSVEMSVLEKGGKGEPDAKWPALVLDKSNYGMPRHETPKWWLVRGKDGRFPVGKISVVDKVKAKQMLYGIVPSESDPVDDDDDDYDLNDW